MDFSEPYYLDRQAPIPDNFLVVLGVAYLFVLTCIQQKSRQNPEFMPVQQPRH